MNHGRSYPAPRPLKLEALFSSTVCGPLLCRPLVSSAHPCSDPSNRVSVRVSTTPEHPPCNSSHSPKQGMLSEAVNVRLTLFCYSQGGAPCLSTCAFSRVATTCPVIGNDAYVCVSSWSFMTFRLSSFNDATVAEITLISQSKENSMHPWMPFFALQHKWTHLKDDIPP